MESSVELRKVPVGRIINLIQVLENYQSWKKLMALIPKDLESKDFTPKYGTEHMNLIESESLKQKRTCTEILIEEWGTSGRKRPTLLHLQQLLIEADLLRAADIVSVSLLNGAPVPRPLSGPAASVDTSLPHLIAVKETNKKDMESLLNNMSYPSVLSANVHTYNRNLNENVAQNNSYGNHKNHLFLPVERKHESRDSNTPSPSNVTVSTNVSSVVSDMIQFSENNLNSTDVTSNSFEMPAISLLLNSNENRMSETNVSQPSSKDNVEQMGSSIGFVSYSETSSLPNIEAFNPSIPNNDSLASHLNTASQYNFPDISGIQISKESNESLKQHEIVENKHYSKSENDSVSKSFSQFVVSESSTDVNISEYNMPMLSVLNNDASAHINTVSLPITSNSLNTALPHYSFLTLQKATNNFNDKLYKEDEDSNARKIGSGGFGSVYLACGLQNTPVAVKKLTFIGPSGMYSEEIISRQFKTEVEILSKYNHINILSLLGYSCDGPSYCLVYEYVEGGSLRESIASKVLLAHDRLNIALHTAKGIEYLHNGYQTPLIHRDVKSANILLTKSLTPKLCDFGLVKILPNPTVTSNIMGTAAYMAPEALRGDVSVKMDVFSFGVVILELLTGLAPLAQVLEGTDIISHVDEICHEGHISPLLDPTAGSWLNADQFFQISNRCLEEKRKRPFISEIVGLIQNIL